MDQIEEWPNTAAFEAIFHRYKDLIFKTAFSLMGNSQDAEDVLQEVFIKVYKSVGNFQGGETEFKAWLRRTTINQCLSNRRRQKPSRSFDQLSDEGFDPSPSESSISPEILCLAKEEREEVQRIIRCLDEKHYVAMVLRYYLDLSYKEIAEALQIPVGTVRSRLHNAIKTIRREFGLRKNSEGEVC